MSDNCDKIVRLTREVQVAALVVDVLCDETVLFSLGHHELVSSLNLGTVGIVAVRSGYHRGYGYQISQGLKHLFLVIFYYLYIIFHIFYRYFKKIAGQRFTALHEGFLYQMDIRRN